MWLQPIKKLHGLALTLLKKNREHQISEQAMNIILENIQLYNIIYKVES
jgi:hypothetical protein